MIGGMLIKDYRKMCQFADIKDSDEKINGIFEQVKNSAYKIIDRKGETSYGFGLALARISQAIVNDENTILSISTFIDDYYGIDDLYLSLPSIINKNGIQETLKINLNEEEINKFRFSANKIKDIIQNIDIN